MKLRPYVQQVSTAVEFIKQKFPGTIDMAVILGTGLSGFENKLSNSFEISYSEIPHFPPSTAPSHKGRMTIGTLKNKTILCLSGRLHWYEGYSMWEVTFPIRIVGCLNINKIIVTNAAGGLAETYEQGDLVFIKDHVNLFPDNPLRGQNHDPWGLRFPDMSEAYSVSGLVAASKVCEDIKLAFKTGVYCGFPGPNLETPAEYRFLHDIGGDLVGMSTVPEVLVARHMHISVMGISLVTNVCYPLDRIQETSVEDVIDMAQKRQPIFYTLISGLVEAWN